MDQSNRQLFEEFRTLVLRLKNGIDLLIQHSENFYVMSELLDAKTAFADSRTFGLMRQAIGFEIVNRIYRLTDKQPDSLSFVTLKKNYLQQHDFLQILFTHFNYDGGKTEQEFHDHVNQTINLIENVQKSGELEKITIFRTRYTAHMIPNPGVLKKFDGESDVHTLQSSDLRLLTDPLATAIDKVKYLEERGMIDLRFIAENARNESLGLWGLIGDEG